MFDFPTSPTLDQVYGNYKWNGYAWAPQAAGGGSVPSTLLLTAGAGLVGGGDLSADRLFDVGAGTGITVAADSVALTVPVAVVNGGTGATTAPAALTSLSAAPVVHGHVINDTSGLQTALDAKVAGPATAVTNRIATFNGTTGKLIQDSGTLISTLQPAITPAALTKADDTNVTLTLGGTPATALLQATSVTAGWTGSLAIARGGTGAITAPAALTSLGAAPVSHNHVAANVTDFSEAVDDRVGALLVQGTNVTLNYNDAANTLTINAAGSGITPAALTKTDDTNVTLTLGGTPSTALLQATSITAGWTGTLAIARGGTGTATGISAATQTALDLKAPLASPAFTGTPTGIAKSHVGLGNVDNTSDANKPVSTATQTALDAKVAKAGDTMTGQLVVNATAAIPLMAHGFSPKGGASSINGAIALGENSSFQGVIQYDTSSGFGKLYIDNTQQQPAAEIIFRTYTSGAARETIKIGGSGDVTISSPASSAVALQVYGYVGSSHAINGTAKGTDASGVIGFATNATTYGNCGSHLSGTATYYSFYGNAGAFISAGTWATSDERLKTITRNVDPVAALSAVNALAVKEYTPSSPAAQSVLSGREDAGPDETLYGWVAQDVEQIIPIAVRDVGVPEYDTDMRAALGGSAVTVKAINDRYMLTTLWSAVQRLSQQNTEMLAEISALKAAT